MMSGLIQAKLVEMQAEIEHQEATGSAKEKSDNKVLSLKLDVVELFATITPFHFHSIAVCNRSLISHSTLPTSRNRLH